MTVLITIGASLLAAFLGHYLTTYRFKNELVIKKKERNIYDAKDMINLYEKELLERVYLTNKYLDTLITIKKSNEGIYSIGKERKEYKNAISNWNLTLDYKYNVIYRSGMLNKMTDFDEIQNKLRNFHEFINDTLNGEKDIKDIEKKLEELKVFKGEIYRFITSLHKKADEKWNFIFSDKKIIKKICNEIFCYIFKTILIYFFISLALFLLTFFFH
ncbi:hypothetical protein VP018_003095 [Morganella morganii]|nr:hypothetical protein [Morganella morganii]